MSIFASSKFWIASGERAVKTAAQTAIATIGTDYVGVTELDWAGIGGVVATATILSVLFSIASGGVNQDGPGIGPETVQRGKYADRDGVMDGRDTPGA